MRVSFMEFLTLNFQNYHFADPLFFLLLLLLLMGFGVYLWLKPKNLSLGFSHQLFKSMLSNRLLSWLNWAYFPNLLRVIALILIVIALMNPQRILDQTTSYKESVDIIIALDISISMESEDIKPNRLEVAKENIIQFVDKRPFDRIGLIVFGSEAFLQCPLTYDHNLLKQFVDKITSLEKISTLTSIGSALSSAILALRGSEAKTKIIILVTDGDNNSGEISPIIAAEIAHKYGIKIYSIGIGKSGQSTTYSTINDPVYGKIRGTFISVLNEKDLKSISQLTGGRYFNVQSSNNFIKTYAEIDRLEKTNIQFDEYQKYQDKFQYWLKLALFFLTLELLLRETWLRRHPE